MEKISLTPQVLPVHSDIFFLNKVLKTSGLAETCRSTAKRGAIFADASLLPSLGCALRDYLKGAGLDFELLAVPQGESSKSRETKQLLEDELLKNRFGRDSLLISLGGGVASDLVGYLASTYMRGVPLLLIPTTLLAMVDAAIGGKNGVDTPFGKNQVGTTYLPRAVFIDPDLLKSLPQREWLNGLAEIVKYGLIASEPIWDLCEQHVFDWQSSAVLEKLLFKSIQTKIQIVEQDPNEKGLRRILNFGHTVGHALELLTHYKIAHGEAVAIGCMAESFLSCHLKLLPESVLERILTLFDKLKFRKSLPDGISKRAFFEAMALDKKAKEGQARFVLIDRIGGALPFDGAYCKAVQMDDLEPLFKWMEAR